MLAYMLDTNICIYVIVTNNLREFARMPGLRVENWI